MDEGFLAKKKKEMVVEFSVKVPAGATSLAVWLGSSELMTKPVKIPVSVRRKCSQ
jgi:hypothetical protein